MPPLPGKWIDGLSGEMSSRRAARLVLDIRLQAVEETIDPAAMRAGDDIEHVHRLRVATRRADAALRMFSLCLPRKRRRRVRSTLRAIRRASGNARICDVHDSAFACRRADANGKKVELLESLILCNTARRTHAQIAIVTCAAELPRPALARARTRLLERARHPEGVDGGRRVAAPFRELAARMLPKRLARVRTAAAADLAVIDNIHDLRIAAKALRYSFEIFRPCVVAGFDSAYASLTALQDELGVINDIAELRTRLDGDLAPAARGAAADALRAELDAERDTRVTAFRRTWAAGEWRPLLERLDRLEHASGECELSLAPEPEPEPDG